jgi:hypothetical protein
MVSAGVAQEYAAGRKPWCWLGLRDLSSLQRWNKLNTVVFQNPIYASLV